MRRRILFVYNDYTLDAVDKNRQALAEIQPDTDFIIYNIQEDDAPSFIVTSLENRVDEVVIGDRVSESMEKYLRKKYKGKKMSG